MLSSRSSNTVPGTRLAERSCWQHCAVTEGSLAAPASCPPVPLHHAGRNKPLKEPLILGNTILGGCGTCPSSPCTAWEQGELQQTQLLVR